MTDEYYTPEPVKQTFEQLAPGLALSYSRKSNPLLPWYLYINVPGEHDHPDSNGEYRFATLREALSYLTDRQHISREEALKLQVKMRFFFDHE